MRLNCLASLGLLAACSGPSTDPSLTLDGDAEMSVHALGPIEAPTVRADGEPVAVEWTSSAEAVVSVQGHDLAAVGPGEAMLDGAWNGQHVRWTVVVSPPVAVRLESPPASMSVGDSVTLQAVVEGSDAPVAWSSSSPAIVHVSDAGELTAASAGSAYVTASAGDAAAMFEVTVTDSATP